MKKVLLLLLSLVLLFSLLSCTDKEEETTAETGTQETQTTPLTVPNGDYSFDVRTEDGVIVTPILPFE